MGRVGCQNHKLPTWPLCPNLNPALFSPAGKLLPPRGGSKDREGRQAIKSKAAIQDNCSRPYPITAPNTTQAGLRSPKEVFNTNPTVALYAKKEGESQPAEVIECELFMLPKQYSLLCIYHDQDGVGGINGGRNYYLSKSFSTQLLIFSFRNITQLIITPYSNTHVFGRWGNITTLLGAHQWHSVGIG